MINPIDENDPFFVSPKQANSRADCPHEIGSDKWLEWQRQFAWEEYTKPSGQERIEAAYQRLKERGFQVVQNNQFNGFIRTLFITQDYGFFEEVLSQNAFNSHTLVLPILYSNPFIRARSLNADASAFNDREEFYWHQINVAQVVATSCCIKKRIEAYHLGRSYLIGQLSMKDLHYKLKLLRP